MDKCAINQATFSDLTQIEALGKKCLPIYYSWMELWVYLINPNYILLKATSLKDNQIVGFSVTEKKDNQTRLHIMSLGVDPDHRREGIATSLIDTLKTYNAPKIAETITLYVLEDNYGAIEFYLKNRFRNVKKLPNYYQSLNKSGYLFEYQNNIT